MNRNNWLSSKPSTKVQYAPGGGSSFSLGWSPQTQQPTNLHPGKIQQPCANRQAQQYATKIAQQQTFSRGLPGQQRFKPVQAPNSQQHPNIPHHQVTQKLQRQTAVSPVKNLCHAHAVRNFTTACRQSCPNTPQLMNRPEVEFITKMVLDELLELNATVMNPEEAKSSILNMLKLAKCIPQMRTQNKAEIVAKQARALVDIWYGSLECAAKKGINLSSVFDLVHAANMRKINPITGMCEKRADGKIVKPAGWCPPNIAEEMQRQAMKGSFS